MFSLNEIVRVTSGQLMQGNGLQKVKGVAIDSRLVKKNDLFIAVKGKRHDGHDFIAQALRNGARAVLVSKKSKTRPIGGSVGIVYVKDTIEALGFIARAHRDKFRIPIVAITGSSGKTTSKELLVCVLKRRFKVLANIGTQNNHIGVPLTLLTIKPSHEMAVVEFGTNCPGDIAWLTRMTRPDIAVMTNIGESHLELLKTPRNVLREKLTLVEGLPHGAPVIYNEDDPFLRMIPRRIKDKVFIRYGIKRQADVMAHQIVRIDNTSLRFKVDGHSFTLRSPVLHNVYNALAALSCGRLFEIGFRRMRDCLKRFNFQQARQKISRLGPMWLIDDTYNANPVSLESALQTLALFQVTGRRILVCGDMLELGKRSKDIHRRSGRMAARLKLDCILTYGPMARFITQGARHARQKVMIRHFKQVTTLNKFLKDFCRKGDVVLIKGSRGMHMERVVSFLQKHF